MKHTESNTVELKSTLEPSLVNEIIAFLNSYLDGTIYTGIDGKENVIQLDSKEQDIIENYASVLTQIFNIYSNKMKQPLVNSSLIVFNISFLNKIYDIFKAIEKP